MITGGYLCHRNVLLSGFHLIAFLPFSSTAVLFPHRKPLFSLASLTFLVFTSPIARSFNSNALNRKDDETKQLPLNRLLIQAPSYVT